MLRLPGGRLVMGSLNARSPANERPSRPATVGAFWMDRAEVTVGAYRTCVDAQTCDQPSRSSPNCTYDSGDRELPVSCVHWRCGDNSWSSPTIACTSISLTIKKFSLAAWATLSARILACLTDSSPLTYKTFKPERAKAQPTCKMIVDLPMPGIPADQGHGPRNNASAHDPVKFPDSRQITLVLINIHFF